LALTSVSGWTSAVYLALWGMATGCGVGLTTASVERRAEVFQALAAALAVGLLTLLSWWRQVGFQRPRNLHLFALPVLALIGAPLLGRVDLSSSSALATLPIGVLITAWSEEVLFRGILWRALLPIGLWRTVAITAVLFGSLHFAKLAIGGSIEDVLPIVIATTLGGVGYSALRYRTASLWPIMAFHAAFNFTSDITHPEVVPGLVLFLSVAVWVGFPRLRRTPVASAP
jgi:membrane protease YdiL (CAAX protease family)